MKVPCSWETHRIELHDDGTARLLDHNEKTMRSFAAFGMTPPDCLDLLEEWEDDPETFIATHADLTLGQFTLLAADWIEHARYPYDGAPEVRLALHLYADKIRDLVRGDCDARDVRAAFNRFVSAIQRLPRPHGYIERYSFAMKSAAGDLQRLVCAEWDSADRGCKFHPAAPPTGLQQLSFVGVPMWTHDAMPDHQRGAEEAWQVAHAVRVLDAVEKGQPWPALS